MRFHARRKDAGRGYDNVFEKSIACSMGFDHGRMCGAKDAV
jgi:hypothetical protein